MLIPADPLLNCCSVFVRRGHTTFFSHLIMARIPLTCNVCVHKKPNKVFREVFLALVTVFFITAIHTVMDAITKPSHRDTVRLVSAPKLIFFALCHTVHLWEHTHELWVNGWEQQQLLYAARREQPLMEPPQNHARGLTLRKPICALQNLSREHRNTQTSDSTQRMQENYLSFQLFGDLTNLQKTQITRNVSGTSSDPSAQSRSSLHFRDAEMQPPLAHTYSLEEQVGDAGYKHTF